MKRILALVIATVLSTAALSAVTEASAVATAPEATSLAVVAAPSNAAVGDDLEVSAQLTAAADGTGVDDAMVTVTLLRPDGTIFASESGSTDTGGQVTFEFPPLDQVGTWEAQATFSGDATYAASTSTAVAFSVKTNVAVTYDGPTSGTAGVAVSLEAMVRTIPSGTPVTDASLTIDFTITGPGGPYQVTSTTNNTGTATGTFVPPAAGQYLVVANSEGTPRYGAASSNPGSLTVTAQMTSISETLSALSAVIGAPPTATAVVSTASGPLSGVTVSFTVVSEDLAENVLSATTDGAGVAKAVMSGISARGAYSVSASFAGDAADSAATSTVAQFTMYEATTLTLSTSGAVQAGQPVTITAQLRSTITEAPEANETILFDVVGAPDDTKATNDNGVASITITPTTAQLDIEATFSPPPGDFFTNHLGALPPAAEVADLQVGPRTPVSVTVSGGQMYGGSAIFTAPSPLPAGVTSTGPVTCLAVEGGTPITTSLGVGTYTIDGSSCTGLSADAVHDLTVVGGSFAVTPAPLTVTASSPTVQYGQAVTVTPSYTGFVAGDTAASLTRAPTCTSTAPAKPAPGTYTTSCSGAIAANYAVSYVNGTLTVTKAATTLRAVPVRIGLLSLTFSATLTRTFDGAALSGRTIAFIVKGTSVCRATTNAQGVASCTVIGLVLGGHQSYTASFTGDADYVASTGTAGL